VFGDDFGCDGGHIWMIDHRGHRGHGVEEKKRLEGDSFQAGFEGWDVEVNE
jgi:hypothetical protein